MEPVLSNAGRASETEDTFQIHSRTTRIRFPAKDDTNTFADVGGPSEYVGFHKAVKRKRFRRLKTYDTKPQTTLKTFFTNTTHIGTES